MGNAHWSQTALDVKVAGVNAYACIPLLVFALRPSSLLVLSIFFLTVLFFIIVENVLKLRAAYVPAALRYTLMGTVRSPKTRNFDL